VKRLFTQLKSGLFVAALLAMYSCSEKDPLPISQAGFKITTIAPEVDLPVQFENLSYNASAYAWDFGDGFTDSLVVDPSHTYEAPGDYLVKLTAYTEDGQKSESIEEISVGEKYLTGMYIANINMKDENGNDWDDDGSGPDVLFQLWPEDAQTVDEAVYVLFDSLNVGFFQTPIGITTDNLVPQDYKLSNKEYNIVLEEIDTVDNEPVFVPMASVVFNPVVQEDEFVNITKREDGTGDMSIPFIVLEEFQFFIEFEIR